MDLSPICFDVSTVSQSFYRTSIDGNARSEIVSLLQKAVRRGDARLVRYATMVMVGSQQIERAVNRFLVMVSEDIGAADAWLAVEMLAVLDSLYYPKRAVKTPSGTVQPWRSMRNEVAVRHFMLALATRFALAEKSRLGDNCSHGYFRVQPDQGDCDDAWLSAEMKADPKLVLSPIMDIAMGRPGAAQEHDFEPMMRRAGYLLAAEKVTTARLCQVLISGYRKRSPPAQQSAPLLRLLDALERVRVLRSGGDPSKGRCTLVHLFYLIWATDRGEYVLPPCPADCVQAVLNCYSREQAESDFARFVTGAWREPSLPSYVKDFHTASAAAAAISVSDWMVREDHALQPRNVVIAQNEAALSFARDQEALLASRKAKEEKKKTKAAAASAKRKAKLAAAKAAASASASGAVEDGEEAIDIEASAASSAIVVVKVPPPAKKQAVEQHQTTIGYQIVHYCQGMEACVCEP